MQLSHLVKSQLPVGTVPGFPSSTGPWGPASGRKPLGHMASATTCFFSPARFIRKLLLVSEREKSQFVMHSAMQHGWSALFIAAGCGSPVCWACFDWDQESDYLIFHSAVWEALIIPLNQDSFIVLCVSVLIAHITPTKPKSKLTSRIFTGRNVPPNRLTARLLLIFCSSVRVKMIKLREKMGKVHVRNTSLVSTGKIPVNSGSLSNSRICPF